MKKEIKIVTKAFTILVVVFAVCFATQANASTVVQNEKITIACENDEYVVVNFEELAEAVQVAINSELEKNEHTIKKVSQHKENKTLKVIAIDTDNNEVTYFFNEDGTRKE
jgi:hypothetical protein